MCAMASASLPRTHPVGHAVWCACGRISSSLQSCAILNSSCEISSDLRKLPTADVKQPQAHQWRSEVYRALELPRNFPSPLESGADLRSRPTIDAHERRTELR